LLYGLLSHLHPGVKRKCITVITVFRNDGFCRHEKRSKNDGGDHSNVSLDAIIRGNLKINEVPWPGVLETSMRPLQEVTIR
jgi:hypothetical protein